MTNNISDWQNEKELREKFLARWENLIPTYSATTVDPPLRQFWIRIGAHLSNATLPLPVIAPLLWCRIHLGLDQITEAEALIHVTFHYQYPVNENPYERLEFDFFSHEIEAQWRYTFCEVLPDGQRKSYPPSFIPAGWVMRQFPAQILPGDVYTTTRRYRRRPNGYWPLFPQRQYKSGNTVRLQIDYCGVCSNILEWKLP